MMCESPQEERRRWFALGRSGSAVAIMMVSAHMAVTPLQSQSLLDRPPNTGGTWVGEPGVFHFHFMHRFEVSEAPARKVTNSPGFLMSVPLPANLMVGARYGTSSVLVNGYPNEWEFFGRYRPIEQEGGAPLDFSLHGGYNHAAASWDGEVAASRRLGALMLHGALRGFSSFRRDDAAWAVGGGAVVRLHQFVAVAADVASLVDRQEDEDVAWSAGIQLGIPYSPHTLSFHAANTHTNTLQSSSIGTVDGVRWGFEFTVPVTAARFFGAGGGSEAAVESVAPAADGAAEVRMDQLSFQPGAIRIRTGETVRWRNMSNLAHTVTADPDRAADRQNVSLPTGATPFHSGDVAPGGTYSRTFTVPGEYRYVCIPHEGAGMSGRIIVE